jgi:hypothetical protein
MVVDAAGPGLAVRGGGCAGRLGRLPLAAGSGHLSRQGMVVGAAGPGLAVRGGGCAGRLSFLFVKRQLI